jgi:hypothetical protein
LEVRRKPDLIDRMSPNPLRRSLRLFGFPIYHCTFCRYQFRDWRKPDQDGAESTRSGTMAKGATNG